MREAQEAEHAREVDDVPFVLSAQQRQEMVAAMDHTPVVDADEPREVLEALLREGPGDHDARVVDE
jgi:hypothetical protein